ncbi:MAG TPA: BON domain-containing protein [Myxococcota bacterium]|nr:BON domain-containing protein [Myxococcota bacterium]
MYRTTVLALAVCSALALGCNRQRPDSTLNAAVLAQLDKEPSLSTAIVHARTEEGHVYLTGRVNTPEQRRRAEDVADDVRGVKAVTNDIQVDVSAAPATQNPPTQAPPPSAVTPEANPPMPAPGPQGNEPPPVTTPTPDPRPESTP